MKDSKIDLQSYTDTLKEIKARVQRARYMAFHTVNKELINLYWDIGKIIVEKQKSEGWGTNIVGRISEDLQNEFLGVRGFTRKNLLRMRRFYKKYMQNEKVATLSRQIGWWHNITILERCENDQEREYYMQMTKVQGLSVRMLREKIQNKEFEHWLLGQSNFKSTLPKELVKKGELILKDEYNLDFLEIEDEVAEKDLESRLIQKIDRFIKEMGGNIMFAGRQVRFEIGDDEFFIDLLFYHKKLRSYIIIELKTDKYKSEYAGKMALYLSLVEDNLVDKEHDNPAIGLILCREKNRDIVSASLRVIARPIGVATYKTYTSTIELPRNISKYLPPIEGIKRKLLALAEG